MEEIKKYEYAYPTTDKFNSLDLFKTRKQKINSTITRKSICRSHLEMVPDLYRDLHTFRITDGEPLMSKDTWGVLDYIINEKNPNRNLKLAINSNLGIPDKLVDRFIDKINKICDEDRVDEFIIFTSVDGWGEQAEYIRNGLEFNRFWDNVNKIFTKNPRVNVTFMVTYM